MKRSRWAKVLGTACVWTLAAGVVAPSPARADLPIYTSPIEVTGLRLDLQASVPDRNSGQTVIMGLPSAAIPSVPLGAAFDTAWRSRRQQMCDQILAQITGMVASAGIDGLGVYDYRCDIATTGQVLYTSNAGWSNEAKPGPSTLGLAYTLSNSSIEFYLRTPGGFTCDRDTAAPFCPNDPGMKVNFTPQLLVSMSAPNGPCSLSATDGTVVMQGTPRLEPRGATNVVAALDDLLLDGFYQDMITRQLSQITRDVDLPFDDAIRRVTAQCANSGSPVGRTLKAFNSPMDTLVEPAQGAIFLRFTHPGLAPPRSMNYAGDGPVVPSFLTPTITAPPIATAGSTITVTGQFFPHLVDPTALPIVFEHDAACPGGTMELEWGPTGGPTRIDPYPIGKCRTENPITGLTPGTAYQFRARDCDDVTCSPWTAPVTLSTLPDSGKVGIDVTLGGVSVGSASTGADGSFTVDVVVPETASTGNQVLRASNGDVGAEVTMQITEGSASAGASTLMLTTTFYGDQGCPMRPYPYNSITTENPISAFGAGFDPGPVTVFLDSADGFNLGTVEAAADGTFCRADFGPLLWDQTGDHSLIAVQDGTVKATVPVVVSRPSVVH